MITIHVDPINCCIEPALPTEVGARLTDELRYHPEGYKHTWNYQHKKWDGYVYLYNIATQKFRTGLLWRVCKLLSNMEVKFQVNDSRRPRETIKDLENINFGDITPYEYQTAAADSVEGSHGVIASPTGTGKTIIMALLVKKYKMRSLIVVNSRVLLDQTHEFFDQVIPGGAGIIGDGDFLVKDVTIATIQSLTSILGVGKKQKPTSSAPLLFEYLQNVGLVIHDEVHEADNNGVDGFYGQVPANVFVGTTATPYAWAYAAEKGKNLEMEQHFGRKAFDSRDIVDFIKLGVTVPLYITRPIAPSAEIFKDYNPEQRSEGEFRDVVDAQVINNQARIDMLAERAKHHVQSGMSCYVFYNRIAYGEKLCEAMGNLDPVMLQGSTPRNQRIKIFKEIDKKKRLLVVSDIGSYGLNIRSLNTLIMAYPAKDARQLKGRVCRAFPGKEYGMVEDPVDYAPYLYRHSELRSNQYKKDGDQMIG